MRHGYYFCDHCEELASGPRCEHCSAMAPTVRWIHVQLHQRDAGPKNPGRSRATCPKPVSPERGRELFLKLHQDLKF